MTSQNNTLRCAASTMYSMAGPNTPSGAVNAPIEDGSAWLDGIVCSLLVPQPVCEGHDGCHCARWLVRDSVRNPPSSPTAFFPGRTREWHGASRPKAIHHLRDRSVLTSVKFPARFAAASVLTAIPYPGRDLTGSTPLQRHADISRQTAGILDDFDPELVSARTEILRPELIDLLWHAGQRVFPARLLLNDGAALVRAQL